MRFADYICTDSFHGIAFSVINEKQFFAFYRTKSNNPMSRNTRIDNILAKLKLADRLITKNIDITNKVGLPIDYGTVQKKLDELRKQSYAFLIGALNSNMGEA